MTAPSDNVHRIGDGDRKDPNLMFSDQLEANSKYKGQGFFTPHPDATAETYTVTQSPERQANSHRPGHRRSHSVPGRQYKDDKGESMDSRRKVFLSNMLNMVDRYWNGSQSLHNHPKFKEQAGHLMAELTSTLASELSSAQDELTSLHVTVYSLKEELEAMRAERREDSPSEGEVKASMKRAKEDMARMHAEIRHYIQENRALQMRLEGGESAPLARHMGGSVGAAQAETTGATQSMMDDLHRQNTALNQEIDLMRSKVKQYHQVQELASMLQESHKSLVETNDHLLRELQDTRHKHQKEIEQMHWSYNQMKSTAAYSANARSFLSGSGNTNNSNNLSNQYSDSLDLRET